MSTSTSSQDRRLSVYDPALATAVADLAWIESVGVKVERFNLSQQPQAFATNEKVLTIVRDTDSSCC